MGTKAKIPLHYNYTVPEALDRLIPPGLTKELVVVKELLDNASDGAERNGGEVSIRMGDDGELWFTNKGVLTLSDIREITDFSKRISDKYTKRGYQRGQVGHGMKIALMLALEWNNALIIESGQYKHVISLKDRYAKNPKNVLTIDSKKEPGHNGETAISLSMPDTATKDYILKHIALNPHITYQFNNETYERTTKGGRSNKVDVFSYTKEEFTHFVDVYGNSGATIDEIVSMFNLSKAKVKGIIDAYKGNPSTLYSLIKSKAKEVKPTCFGEDAIVKRMQDMSLAIDLISYKKKIDGTDSVEVALLNIPYDGSPIISGVNGSCLSSQSVWLRKKTGRNLTDMTLDHTISEIKTSASTILFFSYSSTRPDFRDSNKQNVYIENPKIFNQVKSLYKKTSSSKNWLIKSHIYDQIVNETPLYKNIAMSYNVKPTTYLFMEDCKGIADTMFERFGCITVRQLYYQLVSKGIIANNLNSYQNFDGHLTTARECGLINPDIFEDRSRQVLTPETMSLSTDMETYVKDTLDAALETPSINLWESQPYYIELWIEKDAMTKLFWDIAEKRQIRLFPSRGYTSFTKIVEARDRFREKIKAGKKGIILYAGDLDPSGWNIYKTIAKRMEGLEIDRFALNADQVDGLLSQPLKPSDTRLKSFLVEHPHLSGAYEMDALDPDTLIAMTIKEIDKYYDKTLEPVEDIEAWKHRYDEYKKAIFEKIRLV